MSFLISRGPVQVLGRLTVSPCARLPHSATIAHKALGAGSPFTSVNVLQTMRNVLLGFQGRNFHSTTSRANSSLHPTLLSPTLKQRSSVLPGQRSLSFNFFNRQPSPSPLALAYMARLEADANAHPNDVEKQIALWQELIKYPAGQNRIISRYERFMEFNKQSPLIRSPQIFQLYLQSLIATDRASSVDPAVRHRDAILAAPPPPDEPAPEPKSESQVIAQEVLAASLNKTKESWVSSIRGRLTNATGAAAGSQSAFVNPSDDPTAAGNKAAPVHVVLQEPKGSGAIKAFKFIFLTLLYTFIGLTVLSLILENTGISKGPSAAKKHTEFEASGGGKIYKFTDVHGVDEAKQELEEIVQFLKDPSSFSTLGGRLPKGVLLTGPPGTGKTMLARAVAGEAGVPFLFASGSEFDEMYVGVGAKRIRELFAAARKKQPSIIFIDELDAIGGKRSSRDQQYVKQTLNQLLTELDGFSQDEGIIVIAATNFPEMLDKALVRPGRFDKHVAVPLPDIRGRLQILKHHMQGVRSDTEVDINILARGTPGFSGAELENMVNQAAVKAAREKALVVTLKHFEWAKDKILMGAERTSAFVPEEVKRATAYHEGGHALVNLYTRGAMPLHKVTCIPRGHSLGMTTMLPENDRHSVSYVEYLASIDIAMGGRVAEELIFGKENVTSGASSDLRNATGTANAMIQHWGYSDKVGLAYYDTKDNAMSTEKRHEIETEVDRMLRDSAKRVTTLLTEREKELHLLAEALVEYETLDMQEVKKVIKGEKIRVNEPPVSNTTHAASSGGLPNPEGPLGGEPLPQPPGSGPVGGPLPHPTPQAFMPSPSLPP